MRSDTAPLTTSTSLRARIAAAAAGVALCTALTAVPAVASTTPTTHPAPTRAALQAAADQVVADGVPGTVVLSRRGERTVTVGSGTSDKATGARMRVDDRFHIGSLTKTFVATVVLQLVGEHRLSLGDPVQRWLPDLPTANGVDWSAITVRDLLQHTSGLHDYLEDPSFGVVANYARTYTPRQLVALAVEQGAPRSGWHYANVNYVLAGLIVQAVTGRTIRAEVQTRIVDRLGLASTSFPGTSTAMAAPYAHGYFTPYGDVTTAVNPSVAGAAGAMVSDVTDIERFYRALFDGRLLHRAQLRSLTTAIPVNDEGELYDEHYGLGVYRVQLPCGYAWGHDGGYPGGFKSFAYTSSDGRTQAVLFYNDFGVSDGTDNPAFRAAVQKATAVAFCGRG